MNDREIRGVSQPTVSATYVQTFLGVGRNFPTWFTIEVQRRQLVEGVDHGAAYLPRSGQVRSRGPAPAEYGLTLTAAKKVAMAASGPRGNAVREYFIECERRLLAGEPPIPSPAPPVEPPAPPPNALPDGVHQPSMPERSIPLTMPDFLRRIGMTQARAEAAAAAADNEDALLRAMLSDGLGALVGSR